MRSTVAAGCLAAALLVAGCGSTDGTPTAADDAGSRSTSASASLTTTATPAPTTATPAAYTVVSERVTGSSDTAVWDVQLPQLTGGNPDATAEFNESMRAALDDRIGEDFGNDFVLSGDRSTVTHIGRSVLSGLLLLDWDASPPGAHGAQLVSTVVIDSSTGQPVTLGDMFPDEQAGLQRVSALSRPLLPAARPGATFDDSGTEPVEKNFANWQATPAGMELHFQEYQVGAYALGLITVTVPWSDLQDVLDPRLADVLSS